MSNQKQTDAAMLRAVANDEQMPLIANMLNRIAAQLDSDAKRYEQSEQLQAIGKSAFDSIAEMVAALDCDYERLEELRELETGKHCDGPELEELAELESAAGECKDREEAEQRIHEDPLSVQVRTAWYTPGGSNENQYPEEFEILLGTGGPATRIIGELTNGEPTRARIQAQDWGTPWTDYIGGDSDTLLSYCRCFYFGEG